MREEANLTKAWQIPQIKGFYTYQIKGVLKGTKMYSSEDKWNQKRKEMFENWLSCQQIFPNDSTIIWY